MAEGIMEVRRVLERSDKIKYLILPKKSGFKKDDWVVIRKLNAHDEDDRGQEEPTRQVRVDNSSNGDSNSDKISRWKHIRQLRSPSGDTQQVKSN